MSINNISSPFELSSSSSSAIVEKPRCKPIPNVPDVLQNIEKILRNKNTLTPTEADLFFEEISKSSKKGLGFEICEEDLRGSAIFILEKETGIDAIYVSLPVQAAARTEKFKKMFGIELKEEHLRMGIYKLTEQKLMKSFIDHLSKNFDFTDASTPQELDRILKKLETQQNQVIDPTSSGSSGPKLMLCNRIKDFKEEFNSFKNTELEVNYKEKIDLYYKSLSKDFGKLFNFNWIKEKNKQKQFQKELSKFSDDVNGLGCEIKEGAAIGTTIFILEGENGIGGIYFSLPDVNDTTQINSALGINLNDLDIYAMGRYQLNDLSAMSSFITHFLKNYDLTHTWSLDEINRLKKRIEIQQLIQQSLQDEEKTVERATASQKKAIETFKANLQHLQQRIVNSTSSSSSSATTVFFRSSHSSMNAEESELADIQRATQESLEEWRQRNASSSSSSSSSYSFPSSAEDEEEGRQQAIESSLHSSQKSTG